MKKRIIELLPAVLVDDEGNNVKLSDDQLDMIANEILIVISVALKEEYKRGYLDGKNNDWKD